MKTPNKGNKGKVIDTKNKGNREKVMKTPKVG